jgi:hypothetical protein
MTTINLKTRITNAVLSLSLLLGIGFALGTEAQAQWRDNDDIRRQRQYEREQRRRQREYERQQRRSQRQAQRNGGYYGNDGYGGYGNTGYRTRDNYPNFGGSFDLRQTALNAGYNNGMEEGREDRQRGDSFNYADEGDFRSASKDYSSRLGDRSLYQRYFREAFARGYRDGYEGNTNGYYRNDGYYSPYNY